MDSNLNLNRTLRGGSLKDFSVIKKLGEGSFSQVFLVKRLSDNEQYAMKRVKMCLLQDKEKENALNEVRILASIQCEYIVGYHEAFIDNNNLYVIMEFCQNGDIQHQINKLTKQRKLWDEGQVWKALIDCLRGLLCLHKMNILHRDLKCANIFINSQGVYKLGDLNVSKIAKQGLVFTQTGTPYYCAPEIWRDEPYDLKCDIWSIGCVLYEMCALRPPFKAMNMEELYRKVQKGQFDRIPSKFSDDLFKIIQLCLRVNPSQRPTTEALLDLPVLGKILNNQPQLSKQEQRKEETRNLLDTIKLPSDLLQLKGKLPKPQYKQKNIVSMVAEDIKTIHEVKEEDEIIIGLELKNSQRERIRLLSAAAGRPPQRKVQPNVVQPNIRPVNPHYAVKPPLQQPVKGVRPMPQKNNLPPVVRKRPQSHILQNRIQLLEKELNYNGEKIQQIIDKYQQNNNVRKRPTSVQLMANRQQQQQRDLNVKKDLLDQYQRYQAKQGQRVAKQVNYNRKN